MKFLPTDVSSLSTMISGNYIYVDKTRYIYDLFKSGSRFYFLSRPRRFGKSLLVSTFEEIFSGNKKLFQGLWLGSSDYDWQEYPVIALDFSRIDHGTAEKLENNLLCKIKIIAQSYGINIEQVSAISLALELLVVELSKKNQVVILIDEYDKPILDHLENPEEVKKQRAVLSSFYATIKSLDKYLRFVFLTGVSRFAKTSLFSGINNLNDISLDPIAAQLLGYTQEEIQKNFTPYLQVLAQKDNQPMQEIVQKLQRWYNGYRFSKQEIKVYNPFSVLYALFKQEFSNYWFESGTTTFLIKLMEKQYGAFTYAKEIELPRGSLGNFDIDVLPLVPLLFQTGYLTIVDYDAETDRFKLAPPNFEVEESFTRFSIATLAQTSDAQSYSAMLKLKAALDKNDIEQFCAVLESLLAGIPYPILKEGFYHAILQFLMNLMSLSAQSEVMTSTGRVDLVISTKKRIFIFELKFNSTPQVALQQIKDKQYYQPYLMYNKPITLIGLSFNKKKKSFHLKYVEESLKESLGDTR